MAAFKVGEKVRTMRDTGNVRAGNTGVVCFVSADGRLLMLRLGSATATVDADAVARPGELLLG